MDGFGRGATFFSFFLSRVSAKQCEQTHPIQRSRVGVTMRLGAVHNDIIIYPGEPGSVT